MAEPEMRGLKRPPKANWRKEKKYSMLEQILTWQNLGTAIAQVKRNKGSGGTDGMQTEDIGAYIQAHGNTLRKQILEGNYKPSAVRTVEIPKPQGGKRKLGIPTVIDRVIQQAISQQLTPIYEKQFSNQSYGFRPGRNAHQAVNQAQKYLNEGKIWVIELDLEKFFDKVNHDRLMQLLSKTIADKRLLKLIRAYLRSGIMEDGTVSQRIEGTPQGSPLSPLLSNIVLDDLDKELEKRGHSYVRYADDCSIYVKSESAAKRTAASIIRYIEEELLLKVNREKTRISQPEESTLLGFSFQLHKDGVWEIRIAGKAVGRIKEKCKVITSRSNGMSEEERLKKLKQVTEGWVNYFIIAMAHPVMESLDGFVRTRLRICQWKTWKKPSARIAGLLKAGVKRQRAEKWGYSSKGYCRVANSPILQTTLTNNYFVKRGYVSFLTTYETKRRNAAKPLF
jgi:group II intron reverse transcriptase/maturase